MRINSGGWSDEAQIWISVKIRRNQKVEVYLAQSFARGTIYWIWVDIKQDPGKCYRIVIIKSSKFEFQKLNYLYTKFKTRVRHRYYWDDRTRPRETKTGHGR